MTEPIRLAVYGSLKSTQKNHSVLGDEAVVIARGIRLPGFSLYDVATGWYPGAVRDPDGMGVEVEIIEVPPKMLQVIDGYEGYSDRPDAYCLFTRELITLPNGEEALMYLYNRKLDNKPDGWYKLIPSGRWEDTFDEDTKVCS